MHVRSYEFHKICIFRPIPLLNTIEMAETDEFSVEDQLNYEHEVGEGEADESAEMDDPELEAIKARVKAMEEESEKLKELQKEVDLQLSMPGGGAGGGAQLNLSLEEKMDVDSRSVYIGNVDYGATAEELEQHFHGCGSINRWGAQPHLSAIKIVNC